MVCFLPIRIRIYHNRVVSIVKTITAMEGSLCVMKSVGWQNCRCKFKEFKLYKYQVHIIFLQMGFQRLQSVKRNKVKKLAQ